MKLRYLLALFLPLCAHANNNGYYLPGTITANSCPVNQFADAIAADGTLTCAAPSSSVAWGAITGTLSNQTDLQTALNAKQNSLTTGNLTEATSSILTITGGTNAVIGSGTSIQVNQSSSTVSGYVSSADYPAMIQDPSLVSTFFDDFFGYTPAQNQFWQSAQSGTGATIATAGGAPLIDIAHPGVMRFQTGSTNAGYADLFSGTEFVFGAGQVTFETLIYLSALSNSSDRYVLRIGFGDSFSGAATFASGVWFEYTDNVNSGNFTLNAGNGSTQVTNSSVAPTATSWIKLKLVVNAAGTLVTYYVNGVSVGTVAARIPVVVGNKVNINYQFSKTVGTTNIVMSVDYAYFRQIFTTQR